MEQRKITVFCTQDQKKSVIMSSATTLGELKADLRVNDISYANMDFFEGVSKTKLMADDSQLPHDVPFKGETTNELVFMLSTVNKKIKSGALSRSDMFTLIKNRGLQDAVKAKFGGRNYTQVSTEDLAGFLGNSTTTPATKSVPNQVDKVVESVAKAKEAPVKTKKVAKEVTSEPTTECCADCKVRTTLAKLIQLLYDQDAIDEDEFNELNSDLAGVSESTEEEAPKEKDDLRKLFDNDWMNQ